MNLTRLTAFKCFSVSKWFSAVDFSFIFDKLNWLFASCFDSAILASFPFLFIRAILPKLILLLGESTLSSIILANCFFSIFTFNLLVAKSVSFTSVIRDLKEEVYS